MNDTSIIIEGNKLIAEFMGAKWLFQDDMVYHRYGWFYELDNTPTKWASLWHDNEHLQYHSSWDWLMPVIEKIRTLKTWRADRKELSMFSEITVHIEWDGYNHGSRVCIYGSLTFCHNNTIPHSFNKVEIPYLVKHGDNKQAIIEIVWNIIIEFIQWYNKQKEIYNISFIWLNILDKELKERLSKNIEK